jgi:hypothetical protein
LPGAPKVRPATAENGQTPRTVADYPTPHRSAGDLLTPVRNGLRLAGPGSSGRLRHVWEKAGTAPPRLRSVRLLTGAATDELAMGFARLFGMANAGEQLPHIEAEMLEAIALYRDKGWLDDPTTFHGIPATPAPRTR